jgi:electron transfer flavoprotein alpha subunit
MFSTLTRRSSATLALKRWASTLVLSEPLVFQSTVVPAATCAAVTAAHALEAGSTVDLMVVGNTAPTQVPVGVSTVFYVQTSTAHPTAETIAAALQQQTVTASSSTTTSYTHVMGTSTKFGSTVLPYAAALLGVSPVTDIVDILAPDTYIRPIYAGNALAKVQAKQQQLQVITIRPTSFEKAPLQAVGSITESTTAVPEFAGSVWMAEAVSGGDKPDLGAATVVVSGGRGMGSGANFTLLEALADSLGGAAVGASRAAVDAGMVPNDMQVGQVRAFLTVRRLCLSFFLSLMVP